MLSRRVAVGITPTPIAAPGRDTETVKLVVANPTATPVELGASNVAVGGGFVLAASGREVLGLRGGESLHGIIAGAATNEVQSVTVGTGTTAFTLALGGSTTTSLPGTTTTVAQLQAALQALPSIGAGNVTVTGAAGGPFTVTFVGALGGQNVEQLVVASQTGGAVTVGTTTQGSSGPVAQVQVLETTA